MPATPSCQNLSTKYGAQILTTRREVPDRQAQSSDESPEIQTGKRVMSTIKPSVADKFAEHIPFHRPLADIERIAAGMGSSPTDNGTVEMIVCRPVMYERRVLEEGLLDTTHGLRGDSWGTRPARTPDGGPDPLRQITIMNSQPLPPSRVTAIAGSLPVIS